MRIITQIIIERDALKAENAALKEQVAQLEAEVERMKQAVRDRNYFANKLAAKEETIAQQAEALRAKDEALKEIDLADDDRDFLRGNEVDLVAYALAIQPNPDILRERDARLAERIAHGNIELDEVNLQLIADQIRKGEWK